MNLSGEIHIHGAVLLIFRGGGKTTMPLFRFKLFFYHFFPTV